MELKPEKPLKALLLNEACQLGNIIKKSQWLQKLNGLFQQQLPPILRDHCQIANLRDGCLIIAVISPAWATHLRFQIPELINKLATISAFQGVQTIHYFIQPQFKAQPVNKAKLPLKLSLENAEILTETAQVTSDETLREALLKLAKHSREGA